MTYRNAILQSPSIMSLIRHFHNDQEGDDLKEYFDRAKTYDDIQLIFIFKHLFEYIERVNLGRIKCTIPEILNLVENLENYSVCNEIQYFDEQFIKELVQKDYSNYNEAYGTFPKTLEAIVKDYYQNSFII